MLLMLIVYYPVMTTLKYRFPWKIKKNQVLYFILKQLLKVSLAIFVNLNIHVHYVLMTQCCGCILLWHVYMVTLQVCIINVYYIYAHIHVCPCILSIEHFLKIISCHPTLFSLFLMYRVYYSVLTVMCLNMYSIQMGTVFNMWCDF